ncbi:MAG: PRC-barrel domain-containing protein [Hyphomicrobium sp.]|jgi:hypothetical protein
MTSKLLSGLAVPVFVVLGGVAHAQAPANPPGAAEPQLTQRQSQASPQGQQEWRSSKVVGIAVYNTANERIGDLNDLLVSSDGKVDRAVLGVGGFLGMGEKLIAVPFTDLKFSRDDRGNPRATLNSTKDALQSLPEFTYPESKNR